MLHIEAKPRVTKPVKTFLKLLDFLVSVKALVSDEGTFL